MHTLLKNVDVVAATAAVAASLAVYRILRIFEPFPPGVPIAPLEGRGLVSFLMQHAWSNKYTLQNLTLHETAFRLFSGRPYGIRPFFFKRIVVSSREDIEHILDNPQLFTKGTNYKILEPILGNGLVTLVDNDVHAAHRRVVAPSFSPNALGQISRTTMTRHVLELKKTVDEAIGSQPSCTLAISQLLQRTAMKIVAEAAFRADATSVDKVGGLFELIMKNGFAIELLIPGVNRLPTQRFRDLRGNREKLRVFTEGMVAEVLEEYKGLSPAERRAVVDGGGGKALLDYLALEPSFGAEEVTAHSLTFLFAGHETSSNAMQWALALLATHPEVQQRLFEEVREVLAAGAAPRADDLAAQCPYLECVIKETLRLYPVVALIGRAPVEDTVLPHSKQFVPQSQIIHLNIFNVQRDPALYGADASEFVPERWLDAGLAARVGRGGYLPFSFGSRNCIGMNFALIEIRMILATLVRNFRLEWPDGQPFPCRRLAVTLQPRHDFNIRFVKREAHDE